MATDEESKPLNYIPEVVLKKRRNNEEWAIRRKLQLEERVKRLKSDNFVIKKPDQFIREYRDKVIIITVSLFTTSVFPFLFPFFLWREKCLPTICLIFNVYTVGL